MEKRIARENKYYFSYIKYFVFLVIFLFSNAIFAKRTFRTHSVLKKTSLAEKKNLIIKTQKDIFDIIKDLETGKIHKLGRLLIYIDRYKNALNQDFPKSTKEKIYKSNEKFLIKLFPKEKKDTKKKKKLFPNKDVFLKKLFEKIIVFFKNHPKKVMKNITKQLNKIKKSLVHEYKREKKWGYSYFGSKKDLYFIFDIFSKLSKLNLKSKKPIFYLKEFEKSLKELLQGNVVPSEDQEAFRKFLIENALKNAPSFFNESTYQKILPLFITCKNNNAFRRLYFIRNRDFFYKKAVLKALDFSNPYWMRVILHKIIKGKGNTSTPLSKSIPAGFFKESIKNIPYSVYRTKDDHLIKNLIKNYISDFANRYNPILSIIIDEIQKNTKLKSRKTIYKLFRKSFLRNYADFKKNPDKKMKFKIKNKVFFYNKIIKYIKNNPKKFLKKHYFYFPSYFLKKNITDEKFCKKLILFYNQHKASSWMRKKILKNPDPSNKQMLKNIKVGLISSQKEMDTLFFNPFYPAPKKNPYSLKNQEKLFSWTIGNLQNLLKEKNLKNSKLKKDRERVLKRLKLLSQKDPTLSKLLKDSSLNKKVSQTNFLKWLHKIKSTLPKEAILEKSRTDYKHWERGILSLLKSPLVFPEVIRPKLQKLARFFRENPFKKLFLKKNKTFRTILNAALNRQDPILRNLALKLYLTPNLLVPKEQKNILTTYLNSLSPEKLKKDIHLLCGKKCSQSSSTLPSSLLAFQKRFSQSKKTNIYEIQLLSSFLNRFLSAYKKEAEGMETDCKRKASTPSSCVCQKVGKKIYKLIEKMGKKFNKQPSLTFSQKRPLAHSARKICSLKKIASPNACIQKRIFPVLTPLCDVLQKEKNPLHIPQKYFSRSGTLLETYDKPPAYFCKDKQTGLGSFPLPYLGSQLCKNKTVGFHHPIKELYKNLQKGKIIHLPKVTPKEYLSSLRREIIHGFYHSLENILPFLDKFHLIKMKSFLEFYNKNLKTYRLGNPKLIKKIQSYISKYKKNQARKNRKKFLLKLLGISNDNESIRKTAFFYELEQYLANRYIFMPGHRIQLRPFYQKQQDDPRIQKAINQVKLFESKYPFLISTDKTPHPNDTDFAGELYSFIKEGTEQKHLYKRKNRSPSQIPKKEATTWTISPKTGFRDSIPMHLNHSNWSGLQKVFSKQIESTSVAISKQIDHYGLGLPSKYLDGTVYADSVNSIIKTWNDNTYLLRPLGYLAKQSRKSALKLAGLEKIAKTLNRKTKATFLLMKHKAARRYLLKKHPEFARLDCLLSKRTTKGIKDTQWPKLALIFRGVDTGATFAAMYFSEGAISPLMINMAFVGLSTLELYHRQKEFEKRSQEKAESASEVKALSFLKDPERISRAQSDYSKEVELLSKAQAERDSAIQFLAFDLIASGADFMLRGKGIFKTETTLTKKAEAIKKTFTNALEKGISPAKRAIKILKLIRKYPSRAPRRLLKLVAGKIKNQLKQVLKSAIRNLKEAKIIKRITPAYRKKITYLMNKYDEITNHQLASFIRSNPHIDESKIKLLQTIINNKNFKNLLKGKKINLRNYLKLQTQLRQISPQLPKHIGDILKTQKKFTAFLRLGKLEKAKAFIHKKKFAIEFSNLSKNKIIYSDEITKLLEKYHLKPKDIIHDPSLHKKILNNIEKILYRPHSSIASLDNPKRLAFAEFILGRRLNKSEQESILKAHFIGKPNSKTGLYSYADLKNKIKTLQKGRFSSEEIRTLLKSWVTGFLKESTISQLPIKKTLLENIDALKKEIKKLIEGHVSLASISNDRLKRLINKMKSELGNIPFILRKALPKLEEILEKQGGFSKSIPRMILNRSTKQEILTTLKSGGDLSKFSTSQLKGAYFELKKLVEKQAGVFDDIFMLERMESVVFLRKGGQGEYPLYTLGTSYNYRENFLYHYRGDDAEVYYFTKEELEKGFSLNDFLKKKYTAGKLNIRKNAQGEAFFLDRSGLPITSKIRGNPARPIYVMDSVGNIYYSAAPFRSRYKVHHSSFFYGGPVAGGGYLSLERGKILHIDNSSGHYHPPPESMFSVLENLKTKGFSFKEATIEIVMTEEQALKMNYEKFVLKIAEKLKINPKEIKFSIGSTVDVPRTFSNKDIKELVKKIKLQTK